MEQLQSQSMQTIICTDDNSEKCLINWAVSAKTPEASGWHRITKNSHNLSCQSMTCVKLIIFSFVQIWILYLVCAKHKLKYEQNKHNG